MKCWSESASVTEGFIDFKGLASVMRITAGCWRHFFKGICLKNAELQKLYLFIL